MNDNVKPLFAGVQTRAATMDEIIKDLEGAIAKIRSGEYQPVFGGLAFKNQTGAVFTHTFGEMTTLDLIGVFACAQHLHLEDACSSVKR